MAHIPRIYRPGHLAPGPLLLDGDAARRLAAVMRVRPGEEFLLFAGDGREWRATVVEVGRQALRIDIGEVVRQHPPAELSVEIWAGLIRANRFESLIEKCTEAGADVIRPVITEYAARGDAASAGRRERWDRIATEAAEQCGRLHLPAVEPPAPLSDLVSHHFGPLLIADLGGAEWPAVLPLLPHEGRLAIVVGPEGGLSPAEIASLRARGAIAASFGPSILRTETAAIVATALVRASLPSKRAPLFQP